MDARWRAPRPSGVYIQPASDPNSGTRRQWQAAIWVGPRLQREETGAEERAQLDWRALAAGSGVANYRPGRWDPRVLAAHGPGAADDRANLGSGNSRRRERAAPSASSRRPERDSKGFTWDPLREGLSSPLECMRASLVTSSSITSTATPCPLLAASDYRPLTSCCYCGLTRCIDWACPTRMGS